MGYYIETPSPANKAAQLLQMEETARCVDADDIEELINDPSLGVVCVLHNATFEAAAFVPSSRDLHAFLNPQDPRIRDWLVMDRVKAEKLSGYR